MGFNFVEKNVIGFVSTHRWSWSKTLVACISTPSWSLWVTFRWTHRLKALETQHQGTDTPPVAYLYVHDAEEAHYFLTEEHLAAQPDHHTSGQSSFWIPSVRITEGSEYLHGIAGIDRFYVCILRQFFADTGLAPHGARHTAVVLYEDHEVRGPYDLVHSWRNGTIASQFLQNSLNFIDFNKIRIWPSNIHWTMSSPSWSIGDHYHLHRWELICPIRHPIRPFFHFPIRLPTCYTSPTDFPVRHPIKRVFSEFSCKEKRIFPKSYKEFLFIL